MGTLYLIDSHNTVLNSSRIKDTVSVPSDFSTTTPIRGSFVVNVPFDVPMDGVPQNLGDLITKKYVGMKALYPGYSNILYNEQTDSVGWDITSFMTTGKRQSTSLFLGGIGESTVNTLLSTPTTCIVRWEAFQYALSDDTLSLSQRFYQEADPSEFYATVTFNGGSDWNPVSNGQIFSIPLAVQGNSFRISFINSGPAQRLWLGSWALIY
jgi:hypothetical protein